MYNTFPESVEKRYLRSIDGKIIHEKTKKNNEKYNYFGLTSADLLDVIEWKNDLKNITAIEMEEQVMLFLYRKANLIKLRDRMLCIKDQISNVTPQLLISDSKVAMQKPTLFNLDFCGGFLYIKLDGSAKNVGILENICDYIKNNKNNYILIFTFETRDTGGDEYDKYIGETLRQISQQYEKEDKKHNIEKVLEYYLNNIEEKHFRRMRFCIPIYLLANLFKTYKLEMKPCYKYKGNFIHMTFVIESLNDTNVLSSGTFPFSVTEDIEEILSVDTIELVHRDNEVREKKIEIPLLV